MSSATPEVREPLRQVGEGSVCSDSTGGGRIAQGSDTYRLPALRPRPAPDDLNLPSICARSTPHPADMRPDLLLSDSRQWARLSRVLGPSDFERMLRGAALRVTRPRLAVLSAVHEHPHADTDSIIGLVREGLGKVSHQAVYDVLRALTAAGLVRRIQPMGSVARYELRVGDNHHHIVCRSCGVIADVDCAVGTTPCLTASDDRGFTIDEAEVIYWGQCSDCSTLAASSRSL